jgi:hypothetical protein
MNMSRQLRLLGLAVLALVATGAISATGAQAGLFTAGAYPATITGSSVGAHILHTEIGNMACAPTFHGVLEGPAEELTLVPTYGTSCEIGMKEVHVTNNGCDFKIHAGNTLEEDAVAGTMDIVCPEGNAMDFEITSNPICHLTIPGQAGLSALTYTNRTMAKDVDVDFSIGELVYRLDNNCSVVGNFANGTYGGTSTLKADNGGAATSFGVD